MVIEVKQEVGNRKCVWLVKIMHYCMLAQL